MRLLLLALLTLTASSAQTFESISIEPSAPGAHQQAKPYNPQIFDCQGCSPFLLINQAYEVDQFHYAGPAWTKTELFNVYARIPQPAARDRVRAMLRSLLAEYFHFRFHYEKRQVPAFKLTVAAGGPKLTPTPSDQRNIAFACEGPLNPKLPLDSDGFPILPPGRSNCLNLDGDRRNWRWPGLTLDAFAAWISFELAQPVSNSTGLEGLYDIQLKWAKPKVSGPSLFEALPSQLGLELEPYTATLDVLVVDNIERNSVAFKPSDLPGGPRYNADLPGLCDSCSLAFLIRQSFELTVSSTVRGRTSRRLARQTMASFAANLEESLGKPVVDKTGLPNKYDILIQFADTPSLLEAVQQQLGLILEPQQITHDVLVVDHIERNN